MINGDILPALLFGDFKDDFSRLRTGLDDKLPDWPPAKVRSFAAAVMIARVGMIAGGVFALYALGSLLLGRAILLNGIKYTEGFLVGILSYNLYIKLKLDRLNYIFQDGLLLSSKIDLR